MVGHGSAEAPTALSDVTATLAGEDPSVRADSFIEQRIKSRVFARLFDRQERIKIGRFDVLETIGHGGMGVVYAGYDDELDRKVAIKLLLSDELGSDEARIRFKREAQAMARLSHPNVVTVHEVGEANGRIFIAMEFVRGQDLHAYCCKAARPWREVVELFVQAGRGLIAAHAAGLIHRDFKPHNVIRSDAGVVKVLDFGLARSSATAPDELESEPETGASVLSLALTRAGALLGTLAYMAPELLGDHREADTLSDQFSFCAALYEALHRRLPFDGEGVEAYLANVRANRIRGTAADSKVPGWVQRIVLRGLDPRPERRWPSMRALVDALSRDPSRLWRRVLVGVGVLATGVGGFALADLRAPTPPSCAAAVIELDEVWSPKRSERVRSAMLASGNPLAADTAERVLPRLAAYASGWSAMRVEACERHQSGRHSDRLFDLQTACLDRRLAGFDTVLTALEHADASIVEGAAWAVANLPPIAGCGDVDPLTASVAPPEDPLVAREVQELRELLAGAATLVDIGAYDEAMRRAEQVLERSEALGYAPLEAEAHLQLGTARLEAQRPELARESLSSAITTAVRSGQDEVAAEALARRMWILADPLGLASFALHDAELTAAFVSHAGARPRARWLYLNNYGASLYRAGDAPAAASAYQQALAAIAEVGEPTPIETISTRVNLASLLYTSGQPIAAADELHHALDEVNELLGPEHPRVGYLTMLLGYCLADSGRVREALALSDAALQRAEQSSPHLRATLHALLAYLHLEIREHARARDHAEQALALAQAEFPEAHVHTFALDLRGVARIGEGEAEAGVADARAAFAIEEGRLGPEHEDVGHARWWLGTALLRAGLVDEAIDELERAHAIYAQQGSYGAALVGRESSRLIEALVRRGDLDSASKAMERTLAAQEDAGIDAHSVHRATLLVLRAELELAAGDRSAALADYASSCEILERSAEADDPKLAACRFAWSQLLGDTPRGRELRQTAHAAFVALGPGFAAEASASAPGQ